MFIYPLIIVLNLFPLIGVYFWEWQIFDLVMLYWLENVIVGLIHSVHLTISPISRISFAIFFLIHYSMFLAGHLFFLVVLFSPTVTNTDGPLPSDGLIDYIFHDYEFVSILLVLFVLEVIQRIQNVVKFGTGKEGFRAGIFGPYRRLIILHIAIMFSGFAVIAAGNAGAIFGLVAIIVGKTVFDVYAHKREQKPRPDKEENIRKKKFRTIDDH